MSLEPHLVDELPLESVRVRVEVPELDEAQLAELGHAGVGGLRLK